MAVAEHGCCFYLTISVWILMDNLLKTKSQLPSRGNQISWYFVEFIVPSILNSAPAPLAAKYLQNINHPPLYLIVGTRRFSLYVFCFATKHVDSVYGQNITFWSHLTIELSSSHNSNEVGKLKTLGLLCSVRAVFVPCLQRVCWYGGAVL